ncbi:hypothetical protein BOX15_Mlig016820g2 [Macrostomum lignano]|uniref:Dienelactone hydrolase domain-containing protein n=1 Tax=Macrostomum lignano TaxID=282301 RepID=A0A267GI94_9PLAT|nr:hypothetical protein BOX15_Mlig016820g2 [Macrostomum lignano]
MSSKDEACCRQGTPVDHPPVGATVGTVQKLQSSSADSQLPIYKTGSGRRVGIVAAYDIFGFEVEQTRLFCDELAAAVDGTVVMPDYFRGRAWKQFPIEDQAEFFKWIGEVADAGKAIRDTFDTVIPYMRQQLGDDCPVAIIGFCWGGWVVALTLADSSNPFACGVGLHPSRQSAEDIAKIRAPIALFPAENDPEMAEFLDGIPDKELAARCLHKRFIGVQHGFCTKRSDREKPDTLAKVQEANRDTAEFILERTRRN